MDVTIIKEFSSHARSSAERIKKGSTLYPFEAPVLSSEDEILNVLEKVSKSVVHVNTVRTVSDYFHRALPVKGTGSGFIIEPDGLVLTNAHVVSGAERIGVVLYDNNLVEGKVMGSCRSSDIVAIRIEGDSLPVAELGDSEKLRVGQRVYAIGNPFGLEGGPTITSGVISALNRSIQSPEISMMNLVQTDAAINPGNSGGPLVDTQGRVVAVNTAIIPYAQGIGFAIPINAVKECVERIKHPERYLTPYVGVYGVSVTPQIASYYNLATERGFLVTNVVPESPAYKAEITPGDVIVSLEGVNVRTTEDLKREISRRRIGETASLMIVRGRQRGYINITVEGAQ